MSKSSHGLHHLVDGFLDTFCANDGVPVANSSLKLCATCSDLFSGAGGRDDDAPRLEGRGLGGACPAGMFSKAGSQYRS